MNKLMNELFFLGGGRFFFLFFWQVRSRNFVRNLAREGRLPSVGVALSGQKGGHDPSVVQGLDAVSLPKDEGN